MSSNSFGRARHPTRGGGVVAAAAPAAPSVERAASMTLSRRQRAELPEESISVYLMHGDEITLTRGTGALWQLGAGRANLIDRGLCGCSLARKLRPFLATSFDQ